MFATLYRFWMPAQMFLTMAAFAPVLFLAVFLTKAHLESMSVSAPRGVAAPVVKSDTPVVLVVFDEFALSSLLTGDGRIDPVRYPNFADFAGTSTWYRNATTVYDVTDRAVPAILTGRLRRSDQLPIVADHPKNVFTLLGGSYQVRAFQAEGRLCPTNLCANASPPLGERLKRVLSDVKTTSMRLKPLWQGDWRSPADEVARFLSSIEPSERPRLHVLHALLPHVPYRYLPSGRAYSNGRALPGYSAAGFRWANDPWSVDHNYERYLLQLGYTDEVLGKIVARLRSAGLWDRVARHRDRRPRCQLSPRWPSAIRGPRQRRRHRTDTHVRQATGSAARASRPSECQVDRHRADHCAGTWCRGALEARWHFPLRATSASPGEDRRQELHRQRRQRFMGQGRSRSETNPRVEASAVRLGRRFGLRTGGGSTADREEGRCIPELAQHDHSRSCRSADDRELRPAVAYRPSSRDRHRCRPVGRSGAEACDRRQWAHCRGDHIDEYQRQALILDVRARHRFSSGPERSHHFRATSR